MLVIIDYGVGNLKSIKNMLRKIGYFDVVISNKEEDIQKANKLIIPGVGHFDYGMTQLRKALFFDLLNRKVLQDRTIVLGICLGAQLLTEGSEEGKLPGLGWIKGRTVRFKEQEMDTSLKVPHMGWNDVIIKKKSPLFENMYNAPRYYFVHTYHIQCEYEEDILTTTNYGYEFVAGMEKENIIGVQFHPEKSHKYGMKLLENFVRYY